MDKYECLLMTYIEFAIRCHHWYPATDVSRVLKPTHQLGNYGTREAENVRKRHLNGGSAACFREGNDPKKGS